MVRISLIFSLVLLSSAPVNAQAPTELVFSSDFELGELEDPAMERILDPRFLRDWEQQFPSNRFPRFMTVALTRKPDGSGRQLEFPYLGARALVSSRQEIDLLDGQLLRFKIRARWDELGEGYFEIRLMPEGGQPVILLDGRGRQSEWQSFSHDVVIPDGFGKARLEVLLRAQPGRRGGVLEVDDVRMETVPRIVWGFRSALRRVSQGEEYPLAVSSVSYPTDTYELTFAVHDSSGRERFRETKILLVSEEYPIDYSPRLGRAKGGLPRGIYTVTLKLAAKSGWGVVDERKIALSGKPPFAPRPGGVVWGFDFGHDKTAPGWLPEVPPGSVVLDFHVDDPVAVPEWLSGYPLCAVFAVLPESAGWDESNVLALSPLLSGIHHWLWRGGEEAGTKALASLEKDAPFLRTGFDVSDPGGLPASGDVLLLPVPSTHGLTDLMAFGATDRSWSARLNLNGIPVVEQGPRLARMLFFMAARQPQSVFLDDPDQVLVETSLAGGFVAREALLVWDFATSFLSGAKYLGNEDWHPDAFCLVFRRDEDDFVVVAGDTPAEELLVPGTDRSALHDRTGTRFGLEPDESGLVKIPIGPAPVLVSGLDLAAVRTARSIRARGSEVGEGNERVVTVAATNHYGDPIRITLELTPPSNWETAESLAPQIVEAGAAAEWPMTVTVPDWYGLGGPTVLEGAAILELASGHVVRLPLKVPVPMQSSLVEIEPIRLNADEAEVSVSNLTDEPLRVNVHLQARPSDYEKTTVDVMLAAGERRSFTLSYVQKSEEDDVAELWVGVTVPEKKAYVNRVYRLPR